MGFQKKNFFLSLPYPLTSFEIQKYYQNEPRFNYGVYSRHNLLDKIKDGAYVISLDEISGIDITSFDSFGVGHIPKELERFIGNKNLQKNIFKIQAYDSVMCGYFCIGFIDFMLKSKSLTDFNNLFSPSSFQKMMI